MTKIKFSHFKPAIALGTITMLITAILVVSAIFIPDTSNVLTENLRRSCVALMGEGEFELVLDDTKPDTVNKMIVKDDGLVAFEISAAGFKPPDGITVLVAMEPDGSVRGVVPVLIKDDPGIGTRVKDAAFLESFVGVDEPVTVVKREPSSDNEIMAITGATYSTQGVADAVNIAIEAYRSLYG